MSASLGSGSSAEQDDDGLGIVELIVAIAVSTIILFGIASVLINSWLAQSDVLSMSQATNRGQIVSTSIERAMRNALYFEVQSSGSELWVRTAFDDDRRCQAFHIDDGVAEMKTHATSVSTEAWSRWLDVAEYDQFQVNVTSPALGVFTQTPAAATGATLDYDFEVKTDSAPVQFSGVISIRAGEVGAGGCW
jgi:type II secretory pathway pseudopilin PulG